MNNKNKVLLTFAGTTDPTRSNFDGPILHICRQYRPEKIYLILTDEMSKKDKENNIYERAIKANIKNYLPEIYHIYTDIKEAHKFEVYFNVIYETFERIKKENTNEIEVYVNVSSGTPQLIGSLISYITDTTDELNLIPIQVSTPSNSSNRVVGVPEKYNVETEEKENLDNKAGAENRNIIPDLKQYSRVLVKNQIKELLKQYKYEAIIELLKRNVFNKNSELNILVNYAINRKNLKGLDSNKTLFSLPNKEKYNTIFYNEEKATNAWYQIVDYFALANIKQKAEDISTYILMLEPLIVKIYLSILKDILKVENIDKMIVEDKFKNIDNKLKSYIEKKIGKSLKVDSYVSIHILSIIIEYYIDIKKSKILTATGFKMINDNLKDYKDVRNLLAHSLKIVTRNDFERITSIQKINTTITNFFKKYYTEYGFKGTMLSIYDDINKYIEEILN